MKIAFISDVLFPFCIGGSEIRNYEVAKRLAKKGHAVHMYGIKYWDGPATMTLEGIVMHGLWDNRKIYDEKGRRKAFVALILSIRLFRELLREKFDVLDTLSFVFSNCYAAKAASLVKGGALVFTWQQYFDGYMFGYLGAIKGAIAYFSERFSVGLSDADIAVSEHVEKELVKRGLDKSRIALIENGADVPAIRSVAEESKVYDLIFVGRLAYQKNLMLLIEAAALLVKERPELKICVVGDGEKRQSLVAEVNTRGLGRCFVFKGKEPDRKKIYALMKRSRIFVLTSILEGLPLTAVEANACGIPVVTTRTQWNDIGDFLEKGGSSGIVVPLDARELSKAIGGLLDDEAELQKLGKNGWEKAPQYDWDEVTEKMEKFYQGVLSI